MLARSIITFSKPARLRIIRIGSVTVMNPSHTVQNELTIEFDEAFVLNGFHTTTSVYDPNPVPHVTVRLSNAALRQQGAWYVLHWRLDGGSSVLPRPDNEVSNTQKKQTQKAKRARRQQRNKGVKDGKDKDKDGHAGGSGAPTETGA